MHLMWSVLFLTNKIVKNVKIPYFKWTEREKLEYLEEENEKYQDEIRHLESQLEELQREYEEAEDSISILREQLESYGVEPDEL